MAITGFLYRCLAASPNSIKQRIGSSTSNKGKFSGKPSTGLLTIAPATLPTTSDKTLCRSKLVKGILLYCSCLARSIESCPINKVGAGNLSIKPIPATTERTNHTLGGYTNHYPPEIKD